jgi:aminomethyltransferase
MIVCNASNHDKMAAHFKAAAVGRCEFKDLSDETALIAVQGPNAVRVVAQLGSSTDLGALKSFHVVRTQLSGRPVTVARTGYTGEDGFEIFCANSDAPALWAALLEQGKEWGISPVGLAARDTLRLEARLSLYGNEIDETTNPWEAGLGWVVRLEGREFLGAEALRKLKLSLGERTLVGFEMLGRGIARHGYPLLDKSANPVGQCTSGAPSPTLGKSIGLGYLPLEMSAVGSQFLVDCRGKHIEAQVVKTPFYKRARPS